MQLFAVNIINDVDSISIKEKVLAYRYSKRGKEMDKVKYISDLKVAIKEQGYGKYYSNKCVEYATRLLENNLPVIFDVQHLAMLIGTTPSHLAKMIFADYNFYSETSIPKKSGGFRILHIPALELKYIQRWILDNILKSMHVSQFATGFCDNRSIVDNAKLHLKQECVINMDIKDFFPSVSFERIFRIFAYYGYTKEISFILAKLCTYEKRLPQGSPASPYLSNIACLKLDARLSALATKYDAKYSRYADDITFSGNRGIKKLRLIAATILSEEGFEVNDRKTRIAYPYQRQEVTGLIVNGDAVKVDKRYKRSLLQEIYYCIKFGVQSHMRKIDCEKAFYKEHLYGKAYFVSMVEPEEGKKIFDLLGKIQWDY